MSEVTDETTTTVRRPRQRIGDVVRCMHPKQSLLLAVLIGALAAADGRPPREFFAAAAAVLLVQLSLGLSNDISDQAHDYRAQTPRKPIAGGRVDAGTASYLLMVLVLLSVPISTLNGATAAGALLLTLPIGWIHNRWLHRTAFSFVGWTASAALYPAFLAYGGWAGTVHGDAPTWAVTAAAAAVGFCAHLVTSLGDLVDDNKSGARTLPLQIALRTGAPRLLFVTIVLTAAAVAGLVVAGLTVGLRQ
jgi:4-hydroxybenzoate polyprenyltransferase